MNKINKTHLILSSELDMTYTLFKDAGIDMTTASPYQAVIKQMNYYMDLIENMGY